MKLKTNSGQALLIVLLSMAVVLTIVLSVLARSVTDISISSQDEDSLRAFSAAEAGVEQALIIGSSIGSTEIGNANYSVSVGSFTEGQTEFIYPSNLFSGESATVWFIAHDDDKNYICSAEKPCFTGENIRVCWGKQGTDSSSQTAPAVEVSVFYTSTPGVYSTAKVARMAIDPNSTRRIDNKFVNIQTGTCTVNGIVYPFSRRVDIAELGITNSNIQNVLQFALIRFLYNTNESSPIAFSVPDGSLLPSQGTEIESSGSAGEANRKISVFKFFPEVAEIFQFGAFSFGSIVK